MSGLVDDALKLSNLSRVGAVLGDVWSGTKNVIGNIGKSLANALAAAKNQLMRPINWIKGGLQEISDARAVVRQSVQNFDEINQQIANAKNVIQDVQNIPTQLKNTIVQGVNDAVQTTGQQINQIYNSTGQALNNLQEHLNQAITIPMVKSGPIQEITDESLEQLNRLYGGGRRGIGGGPRDIGDIIKAQARKAIKAKSDAYFDSLYGHI